jgi:diacylglycerol O-acyltransferase / wax synthase
MDSDKYLSLGRRRNCNPAVVLVAILPRALCLEELIGELSRSLPADGSALGRHGREVSLPPGSGWRQVFAEIDAIQSAPFRPGLPPWEIAVVNGAPGGRSALAVKAHRALGDDAVLAARFAGGPGPWAAPPDRSAARRRCLREAAWMLPELADGERRRREAAAIREFLRPPPRRPVASSRRTRRVACFRIQAELWRAEAESRGGGADELLLALVARVMREALDSLEAGPAPLRLAMPVRRSAGHGHHDGVGIVELAGGADELDDLSAVRERAAAARRGAAGARPVGQALVDLLPPPLRAAIEFRQGARCDALVSSIANPMREQLLGVPIETAFTVAPAIGQAASFSLAAHGEHLCLTSNADLGTMPAPLGGRVKDALAELFGERFESFEEGGKRDVPK